MDQPMPAKPIAPAETAGQKSTSPWPWIFSGCLIITILICTTIFFLGWWGMREAKNAINEQIDRSGIQKNVDRFNQEGEEWQKKSEEFRNSMPDPDDLSDQLETDMPVSSVKTKKK